MSIIRSLADFEKEIESIGRKTGIPNTGMWVALGEEYGFFMDFDREQIYHPDLKNILIEGKVVFTDSRSNFQSKTFTNPTYEDLIVSAIWAVEMRWPTDHVFLESIREDGMDSNGNLKYRMYFGS